MHMTFLQADSSW